MHPPAPSLLALRVDAATLSALRALGWQVNTGAEVPGVAASRASIQSAPRHDAVLLQAGSAASLREIAALQGLSASALESAWVVQTAVHDPALETELLRLGIEAILPMPAKDASAVLAPDATAEDASASSSNSESMLTLARQLSHAVQRKQLEIAARTAYATDLATGLPHLAQLVEHMTQLLALREREPAPMVLLVLRVDGFVQAASRLGVESANVLRRKVAVRLRSGLRASDVVAAIAPDAFGVLLGRLESKGDGAAVAAKLVRSLALPFSVAGEACSVQVSAGLALYPEHGRDVNSLLQRASAQAGSVALLGPEGMAVRTERSSGAAANDDEAS